MGAVCLLCAGICGQILGIIELGGIHENAYHHKIVFLSCTVYQGYVSCMQCTHCGHQADAFAFGACLGYTSAQTVDCSDYFHFRQSYFSMTRFQPGGCYLQIACKGNKLL